MAAVVVAAACSGGASTSAGPSVASASGGTAAPSGASSSTPTATPATPATAPPSVNRSASPSAPGPTATGAPSASVGSPAPSSALVAWTGDPPIDSERIVLGHVPPGVWDTCESTEQRWGGEVDAVFCFNRTFDATYATFLAEDVLQAAYSLDVAEAGVSGSSAGTAACAKPPAEAGWSAGALHGRALCTEYDDFGTLHRVIEWTAESGLVIGYLTSTELGWTDLIAAWERARATS